MHTANRKIFATKEEILNCKGNEKEFKRFLALLNTSGWLKIATYKKVRAYNKADYSEWMSFIIQGVHNAIEKADDRITIPSVLRLSIWWAQTEYKKLYINKAQKLEDESDAMEKDCDGNLMDITIPDVDSRFEDVEIREFLAMMEKKLPSREMNIFIEIMYNETPLRELGKSIDITGERVRQIMEKARKHGIYLLAKSAGMTPKEYKLAHTKKEVLNVV